MVRGVLTAQLKNTNTWATRKSANIAGHHPMEVVVRIVLDYGRSLTNSVSPLPSKRDVQLYWPGLERHGYRRRLLMEIGNLT